MTTGLEHLPLCREEEGAGGIQPGEEKATGRSQCSLLILELISRKGINSLHF